MGRSGSPAMSGPSLPAACPVTPRQRQLTWRTPFSICCQLMARDVVLRACVASLACLTGCGGAAPLLHPAQTLPVDRVDLGAGVSGNFGSSGVRQAIDRGRSAAGQPLTNPVRAAEYAEGILTQALIAPGTTPWVAARTGVAENMEAGLTYTGRGLRLDGRHAWPAGDQWTLSVGLGASALLLTPERAQGRAAEAPTEQSNPQAELEASAKGWGLDLPILLGYRMLEGFGDVWLGPRLGFERLAGDVRVVDSEPGFLELDVSGSRLWAGLLAGFSLGIPPVWIRFELSATYHRLSGELESADDARPLDFDAVEASGWTFAPSGALVGKF